MANLTEEHSFTINMEKTGPMQFTTTFDKSQFPDISFDESEKSGGNNRYPDASRYLTAAIMNCLSASLTFCLNKSRIGIKSLTTTGICTSSRNEEGYWRIKKIKVELHPVFDTNIDDTNTEQRIKRCRDIFEKYCVVSASVRKGIPIDVDIK